MRSTGWRRRQRVVLGTVAGALLAACGSAPPAPSASLGIVAQRVVPSALRTLPLTDQGGRAVDLASWPGKTVLLVPFLTLCSDICPMTTGNLLQVEHALVHDGVAAKIEVVELSVDPGRDSPARLAAYANLTGANWELVTESSSVLAQVAKFFGFTYQIVPQDDPPSVDWWTGKPLTYDVDHSDGFVVIDPQGTERFVTGAAPNFHGTLDPTLKKFLSPLGLQHLAHPVSPNYTPSTILGVLGWELGRTLPAS